MAIAKEPGDPGEEQTSVSGDGGADAGGSGMATAVRPRPPLPTSCSVPLFLEGGEEEEVAGWSSEAEVATSTVTSLNLTAFRSPHKVQFAEHIDRTTFPKTPTGRKKKSRTLSETSTTSISSATSSTTSLPGAPDGGFGWVVVAASFFVNMIADGVTFSFGVMFDEFQDEFDCSKAAAAAVVSVFHSLPLLTGPIATWLTDRYGCKYVTILGSIMAAMGFLAAAFSHNIYLLYLFFGVLAGFGLSLCYVAAIIIVAYYFDRRRSFATGISVCGSGVGTFVFAPLTQHLMDTYGGWRGACIVLAGVFLNMAVCGMLYRDLPALASRRRLGRASPSSSRSLGPPSSMPEIEQLRTALEAGDVTHLLGDQADQPMLASSLLTLPTYIKNTNQLPEDVLQMLIHNQQTFKYIQENYPGSLSTARSVSDYKLEETRKPEDKTESKGVKLKRRVSSLMRTKSILKKKGNDVTDDERVGEVSREANPATLPDSMDRPRLSIPDYRAKRLHNLKLRRQSLTYRGACLSTARYRMRASSCPDIYRNSIGDLTNQEEGVLVEFKEVVRTCCSLSFITLGFSVFCFSNFVLYFWYDVPYVYTLGYTEKILKVPATESSLILSVIGILNTVGEVAVGWLADMPRVSTPALYAACMLVCGIVTAIVPAVSSYPAILLLSALYGLCISANYSLTSPILVELVSLEQFSSAYGFLLFCQGVGNLVGPPVAGWLYDATGEWVLTFLLAGLFMAASGALVLVRCGGKGGGGGDEEGGGEGGGERGRQGADV